jgi:hypothetical protein
VPKARLFLLAFFMLHVLLAHYSALNSCQASITCMHACDIVLLTQCNTLHSALNICRGTLCCICWRGYCCQVRDIEAEVFGARVTVVWCEVWLVATSHDSHRFQHCTTAD